MVLTRCRYKSLNFQIALRFFYPQTPCGRIQRSDDRRSKSEVEIRPPGHRAYASAGSRKAWKTDVRLYFYPINLFNPVNQSTIYTCNPFSPPIFHYAMSYSMRSRPAFPIPYSDIKSLCYLCSAFSHPSSVLCPLFSVICVLPSAICPLPTMRYALCPLVPPSTPPYPPVSATQKS